MSVPAPLLAHYATGSTTLAWALLLERSDGEVYGWTSADRDATLSAQLYRAAPGLDVAAFATSAGFGVDNTEITVVADDLVITRADIMAGRWDNAAWTLMRYNWADLADGVEVRGTGHLGQLQPRAGAYVAELRGLQQFLQQPVGSVSTKTCRYRLGSTAMPEGLCTVDLAPFTEAGSVTAVASQQVFTDSARTEADDWFSEGILTWTSGLNAGLIQKVKAYAADVFTLSLPMVFAIEVGDGYSVVAGCQRRFEEDCRDKFDNAINFGAEPHRPTIDDLTSAPEATA